MEGLAARSVFCWLGFRNGPDRASSSDFIWTRLFNVWTIGLVDHFFSSLHRDETGRTRTVDSLSYVADVKTIKYERRISYRYEGYNTVYDVLLWTGAVRKETGRRDPHQLRVPLHTQQTDPTLKIPDETTWPTSMHRISGKPIRTRNWILCRAVLSLGEVGNHSSFLRLLASY